MAVLASDDVCEHDATLLVVLDPDWNVWIFCWTNSVSLNDMPCQCTKTLGKLRRFSYPKTRCETLENLSDKLVNSRNRNLLLGSISKLGNTFWPQQERFLCVHLRAFHEFDPNSPNVHCKLGNYFLNKTLTYSYEWSNKFRAIPSRHDEVKSLTKTSG